MAAISSSSVSSCLKRAIASVLASALPPSIWQTRSKRARFHRVCFRRTDLVTRQTLRCSNGLRLSSRQCPQAHASPPPRRNRHHHPQSAPLHHDLLNFVPFYSARRRIQLRSNHKSSGRMPRITESTPMQYTVGSYLAARFSQIGLKLHLPFPQAAWLSSFHLRGQYHDQPR
jgi:hypothetical protein